MTVTERAIVLRCKELCWSWALSQASLSTIQAVRDEVDRMNEMINSQHPTDGTHLNDEQWRDLAHTHLSNLKDSKLALAILSESSSFVDYTQSSRDMIDQCKQGNSASLLVLDKLLEADGYEEIHSIIDSERNSAEMHGQANVCLCLNRLAASLFQETSKKGAVSAIETAKRLLLNEIEYTNKAATNLVIVGARFKQARAHAMQLDSLQLVSQDSEKEVSSND